MVLFCTQMDSLHAFVNGDIVWHKGRHFGFDTERWNKQTHPGTQEMIRTTREPRRYFFNQNYSNSNIHHSFNALKVVQYAKMYKNCLKNAQKMCMSPLAPGLLISLDPIHTFSKKSRPHGVFSNRFHPSTRIRLIVLKTPRSRPDCACAAHAHWEPKKDASLFEERRITISYYKFSPFKMSVKSL